MSNIVDDKLTGILERGMDYASIRQQVLANNVANVNTPGFKRSDVSFSQVMKNMGDQDDASDSDDSSGMTDSRHFSLNSNSGNRLSAFISHTNTTQVRNDGNNVDVNVEMGDSAKNGLYQQALTQMMARRFRLVKDVIKGR